MVCQEYFFGVCASLNFANCFCINKYFCRCKYAFSQIITWERPKTQSQARRPGRASKAARKAAISLVLVSCSHSSSPITIRKKAPERRACRSSTTEAPAAFCMGVRTCIGSPPGLYSMKKRRRSLREGASVAVKHGGDVVVLSRGGMVW